MLFKLNKENIGSRSNQGVAISYPTQKSNRKKSLTQKKLLGEVWPELLLIKSEFFTNFNASLPGFD